MKKILIFITLLITAFFFITPTTKASSDLDRITSYTIKITPDSKGNLFMEYDIKWKVLDSSTDGPLEWVKIGVPNKYITDLKATSSDIKSIKYYPNGGAYVRCDLSSKFYKNEVAHISFSFYQSRIFTLKDGEVQYRFNPGWFDEILVDKLRVEFKNDGYKFTNCDKEEAGYNIWEASLSYGKTINVDMTYDQSYFTDLDPNNTWSSDDGDPTMWIVLGIVLFVVFIIAGIALYKKITDDGYYAYRGFSGVYHRPYYYYFHHHHHGVDRHGKVTSDPRIVNSGSSGHSSSGGGHSCACACACACAGGGRAGCSRKDFYNPNLSISEFIDKLNEEE